MKPLCRHLNIFLNTKSVAWKVAKLWHRLRIQAVFVLRDLLALASGGTGTEYLSFSILGVTSPAKYLCGGVFVFLKFIFTVKQLQKIGIDFEGNGQCIFDFCLGILI